MVFFLFGRYKRLGDRTFSSTAARFRVGVLLSWVAVPAVLLLFALLVPQ